MKKESTTTLRKDILLVFMLVRSALIAVMVTGIIVA
jgi:hypothetical protein